MALESGVAASADIILLPEIDVDVAVVAAVCREREARRRPTVICVAERAKVHGHVQRGGDPVAADRVLGARLAGVCFQESA